MSRIVRNTAAFVTVMSLLTVACGEPTIVEEEVPAVVEAPTSQWDLLPDEYDLVGARPSASPVDKDQALAHEFPEGEPEEDDSERSYIPRIPVE